MTFETKIFQVMTHHLHKKFHSEKLDQAPLKYTFGAIYSNLTEPLLRCILSNTVAHTPTQIKYMHYKQPWPEKHKICGHFCLHYFIRVTHIVLSPKIRGSHCSICTMQNKAHIKTIYMSVTTYNQLPESNVLSSVHSLQSCSGRISVSAPHRQLLQCSTASGLEEQCIALSRSRHITNTSVMQLRCCRLWMNLYADITVDSINKGPNKVYTWKVGLYPRQIIRCDPAPVNEAAWAQSYQ